MKMVNNMENNLEALIENQIRLEKTTKYMVLQ